MTDQPSRLRIDDFDYDLPHELIAQEPLADRTSSRLLVMDRKTGELQHSRFSELPEYLRSGDVIVINDTRVIPARLLGHRESGGQVEVLLLRSEGDGTWRALAKPTKRLKIGERIEIPSRSANGASANVTLLEKADAGQVVVQVDGSLADHLDDYGNVPLPPYITHQLDDPDRYQTVYADQRGSAAAPTAGLHFTDDLLQQIQSNGIQIAHVTLHVGLDTFRPVSEEFADDHEIHSEWCGVDQAAYETIMAAKRDGRRVIAVGTTSARTLETLGQRERNGESGPFGDFTRIYITPGYEWTIVDGMITNFHLPKSTLLLMISSFAGKDHVFAAYNEAIRERYRFFSFGDAMFIS